MSTAEAARVAIWESAHRDAQVDSSTTPTRAFYATKLSTVWERARETSAYTTLPDWSWEAFASLPATTKSAVKNDPWSFLRINLDQAARYYETTGTSGVVTPTPRSHEDIIWNVASVAAAWSRVLSPGNRVLALLPSDIVPVADLVAGVCDSLGVTHSRAYPYAAGISGWDRVLELWQRLRPTAVFCAPGVLLDLTRLLKHRRVLEQYPAPVDTIMLLGEVSSPALRARLSTIWDARVHDASYGSTETGTIAACCERGRLHLLPRAHAIEIEGVQGSTLVEAGLDTSSPLVGRLIVTPLHGYARPLLRFDTGDDVTLSRDCNCDQAAPTLTVHGRAEDALEVGRTRLTAQSVEQLVFTHTHALGYLLESNRELDAVRLLLERDPTVSRTEEQLCAAALREASAHDGGIEWSDVVWLNALPATTKSGASQKSWKRSNVRQVDGS